MGIRTFIQTISTQNRYSLLENVKVAGGSFEYNHSNLILGSLFTVSEGKLNANGTSSGMNNIAFFDNDLTYGENQTVDADFKINNLNSVFGLVKFNTDSNAKSGGYMEIDFISNKLKSYLGYIYPTSPTIGSEADIDIDINTNDLYNLRWDRDNLYIKITLTNKTQNTKTIFNTVRGGSLRGNVGIVFKSGNIDFFCLNACIRPTPNPLLLINGDSYVDNGSIYNENNDSYDNLKTWTYKIIQKYPNRVVSCGWGGFKITDMVQWKANTLTPFTPKYYLQVAGLNPTSYSVWLSDINIMINEAQSKGAEIILSTLPPIASRNQVYLSQINNYVINSGYQFLDIAKALTINGDRVTLDNSLLLSDLTHPNLLGQQKIFNEFENLNIVK